MKKKTTTVRMPEDLGDTVEAVARAQGVSVNSFIVTALETEIERVRQSDDFMGRLHGIIEKDREILERLAK